MYNYITGTITQVGDGIIVIDTGGVGYLVNATQGLIDSVKLGQVQKVFVHLDIRETSHTLYGFVSGDERDLFKILQSVSGVGTKSALAMLAVGAGNLAGAIAGGNPHTIAKAKGVSIKLADKVILELKGKIIKNFSDIAVDIQKNTGKRNEIEDAIEGLAALGLSRAVAIDLVTSIDTRDKTAEEIIVSALARRDKRSHG